MDLRGAVMLNGHAVGDDGLVDMHLQHMRARGLSALTIKARSLVLARLEIYLAATPSGATTTSLETYLHMRRACPGRSGGYVSPNTIRNELAHLRAYYGWLVRHEYRREDPTARLDMPRLVKADVQPADDDAIAEALARTNDDDRIILVLSAFGGLRASEIANLTWGEVDLRRSTITIRRGKGGKTRIVGVSQPVRDVLLALPHRQGPVVRRRDGQPKPNAPGQISKRASALLGGRAAGFTLHQLRHRFATAAYAGTRDLRSVQDALGHSSPQTTALYAHTRGEALQAAADAAATLHLIGEAV